MLALSSFVKKKTFWSLKPIIVGKCNGPTHWKSDRERMSWKLSLLWDGSFLLTTLVIHWIVFKSEMCGLSSEPTDKLIRCSCIGQSMLHAFFSTGISPHRAQSFLIFWCKTTNSSFLRVSYLSVCNETTPVSYHNDYTTRPSTGGCASFTICS